MVIEIKKAPTVRSENSSQESKIASALDSDYGQLLLRVELRLAARGEIPSSELNGTSNTKFEVSREVLEKMVVAKAISPLATIAQAAVVLEELQLRGYELERFLTRYAQLADQAKQPDQVE